MKIHAPYSLAAAVLIVMSVGVGLTNRPHASVAQALRGPPPAPPLPIRGNLAPSLAPPQEGAVIGSGVATPP